MLAKMVAQMWRARGKPAGAASTPEAVEVERLLNRARALRKAGDLVAAQALFREALVLAPTTPDAWLDLGSCHYRLKDYFWARFYYRISSFLDPHNADVWNELGLVEIMLGNYEQAEQSLENAVNRSPEHPEAWNNLGLILARRGDKQNARRHFRRAVDLNPDNYTAWCNLGLVCRELEDFSAAETALFQALQLNPDGIEALVTLGSVMQDRGELENALHLMQRAHRAAPGDADVCAALSALHLRCGNATDAERAAQDGLKLDPLHAESRLALAHVQLAQGRFSEGWDNYEARRVTARSPVRQLAFTPWTNELLPNRTILVYGEQGLGDEIMFASCIPELVRAGANVLLQCDPRLAKLFARSFPTCELVEEEELEDFVKRRKVDFCCPIGSLPLRFRRARESFGLGAGYLRADPATVAAWHGRLRSERQLSVGLTWRAGSAQTGRAFRSLPLEHLAPLFELSSVRWISLQHDASKEELQGYPIDTCAEDLRNPDSLAAIMASLDLNIAVCSTTVHLAGALGLPVWVLTPYAPAWRYLLEGEHVPWYASARLYRQPNRHDWTSVVIRMREELERFGEQLCRPS